MVLNKVCLSKCCDGWSAPCWQDGLDLVHPGELSKLTQIQPLGSTCSWGLILWVKLYMRNCPCWWQWCSVPGALQSSSWQRRPCPMLQSLYCQSPSSKQQNRHPGRQRWTKQHKQIGGSRKHSVWGWWLQRVPGHMWSPPANSVKILQSHSKGIWSSVVQGKLHAALHFQQSSAWLDMGGLLWGWNWGF